MCEMSSTPYYRQLQVVQLWVLFFSSSHACEQHACLFPGEVAGENALLTGSDHHDKIPKLPGVRVQRDSLVLEGRSYRPGGLGEQLAGQHRPAGLRSPPGGQLPQQVQRTGHMGQRTLRTQGQPGPGHTAAEGPVLEGPAVGTHPQQEQPGSHRTGGHHTPGGPFVRMAEGAHGGHMDEAVGGLQSREGVLQNWGCLHSLPGLPEDPAGGCRSAARWYVPGPLHDHLPWGP